MSPLQQVDNLIEQQQPFRLSYQDAAERLWSYTVLHARVVPIEKRQYLMCRAEESEGNQDVEGLRHNWSLRLDRIAEAAVVSIEKPWLDDLERIPVEFHLSGGLAFAYKRKYEDEFVSELQGEPPIRRVIRNISGTFWFFREISRYGNDYYNDDRILHKVPSNEMLKVRGSTLGANEKFCRYSHPWEECNATVWH
ncbi:MAG: hypothetical protein ACFB02_18850 [Mastigocoleus sp.]